MKPTEDTEKLIKNLEDKTSAEMDQRVIDDALLALENSQIKQVPTWRLIMKNNITKFAAAAVVIIAAVIIVNQFDGSIDGSGIVWAEVLEKIENSKGLIFQRTISDQPNVYSIVYKTPKYTRTDSYLDGKIGNIAYANYESMIHTMVWPEKKFYLTNIMNTKSVGFFGTNKDQINPMNMLKRILSYRHYKLESQINEGVLCEGIETTDPNFCFDSLPEEEADKIGSLEIHIQLWIETKTQYPVMAKWEGHVMTEEQVIDTSVLLNQFQWNLDLDPSIFEPEIPPDYRDITPPALRQQM